MTEQSPHRGEAEPRRNFLSKLMALAVGSVIGLIPLVAGVAMLADPLLKRRKSIQGTDEDGFLKVTSASSLPRDGQPRLFKVVADRQDAWNTFPQTEIGSVYLRQTASGDVEALAARCPHLGCTVDYKSGQELFACPCHDSSFDLDGSRNNEIPPRPMDSLPTEIRNGEVWVKFQKFRAGVPEKIPV